MQRAAIYNGEIYNHAKLQPFRAAELTGASDGEVLLPAYEKYGPNFPRWLDGEFAVAVLDISKDRVVLATDSFGSKPLWYAIHRTLRLFAAASYRSALAALSVFSSSDIRLVPPNSALVFDVPHGKPPQLAQHSTVFEFDLRQMKQDTTDWEKAFAHAVTPLAFRQFFIFVPLEASRHLEVSPGRILTCIIQIYTQNRGKASSRNENRGKPKFQKLRKIKISGFHFPDLSRWLYIEFGA